MSQDRSAMQLFEPTGSAEAPAGRSMRARVAVLLVLASLASFLPGCEVLLFYYLLGQDEDNWDTIGEVTCGPDGARADGKLVIPMRKEPPARPRSIVRRGRSVRGRILSAMTGERAIRAPVRETAGADSCAPPLIPCAMTGVSETRAPPKRNVSPESAWKRGLCG